MDRHPICGKMDTQKQLNVPLDGRGGGPRGDSRRRPGGESGGGRVEWYIKLFLGVHFADNLD